MAASESRLPGWMMNGVYFTMKLMHKMKKVKTPMSLACDEDRTEDLEHILLKCEFYNQIRESYLPKYISLNLNVLNIIDNNQMTITTILDPLSAKIPAQVTRNWKSVTDAYQISRSFCFNIYRKHEKFYKKLESL